MAFVHAGESCVNVWQRHKSQEGERKEETEPDEGEREDEAEQDEGEVEDEAEQITAHQAPTSAPDHAPPN